MDDCIAVVDDREKLVSLSEERRSAADEVEEKLKQNGSSGTGGGGLINQLMSNLPSVVLLHHKEQQEEDVVVDHEVVQVEMIVEKKQEEEEEEEINGGTGILNRILSHFHEPAAPLREVESREEEAAGESIDGGEQSISTTSIEKHEIDGGGGIIDKIMSHLHGFGETAATPAAADQEEFVHSHDEQAQLQEVGSNHKEQVTESNGGGLLNQIITNLPTVSIPDHGTSPKAEEASLLIHIVQD